MRVVELYDEGYTLAVSIDLRHYFDTIPQDLLMTLIRKTVRDLTFTELIKRFLKSGVATLLTFLSGQRRGPLKGALFPLSWRISILTNSTRTRTQGPAFCKVCR